MLKLINRGGSVLSDLFEPYPNQDSAANMIALNTRQATLTALNTRHLFGFAVKLLNLPAQATHVSCGLRVILSQVVGGDIIRALGGEHQPEQFHLMPLGKILDVEGFAMLLVVVSPRQAINALVGPFLMAVIDQAIVFQWAVIDLVQALDVQHQLTLGIPCVHQHPTKRQFLVIQCVVKHLTHMIQFGLAVVVWVINSIVDDPELVKLRIDVHTGHDPNAFDQTVRIAAVLPPHDLDLERTIMIQHRIIKRHVAHRATHHLPFDVLPDQPWGDFVSFQIAFHRVMAKALAVVSEVGQGVVDLAHQQKLTIIEASYCIHLSSLAFQLFFALLRKSYEY